MATPETERIFRILTNDQVVWSRMTEAITQITQFAHMWRSGEEGLFTDEEIAWLRVGERLRDAVEYKWIDTPQYRMDRLLGHTIGQIIDELVNEALSHVEWDELAKRLIARMKEEAA